MTSQKKEDLDQAHAIIKCRLAKSEAPRAASHLSHPKIVALECNQSFSASFLKVCSVRLASQGKQNKLEVGDAKHIEKF